MIQPLASDLEWFNLVFAGKIQLLPDESRGTGGKHKVIAESIVEGLRESTYSDHGAPGLCYHVD